MNEFAHVEDAGHAGAEAAVSVGAGVGERAHQIVCALTHRAPLRRNEVEGPDLIRQTWIGFLFRRVK